MKRIISILLILTLAMSVFTVTSIYSFAEETGTENTETINPEEETTNTPTDGEGEETDAPTDGEGTGTDAPTEGEGEGEGTTEGEGEGEGEGTTEGDGTTEDGEETPEEDDNSNPINDFLAEYLPVEALGDLKDTLFGFIDDVWDFIMSEESYQNLATGALAVLALFMIPILIGLVVVVYAAIGAMIIFASALTSILELIFPMIPGILA